MSASRKGLDPVADVVRGARLFRDLFTGRTTVGDVLASEPPPDTCRETPEAKRCKRSPGCIEPEGHEGGCTLDVPEDACTTR